MPSRSPSPEPRRREDTQRRRGRESPPREEQDIGDPVTSAPESNTSHSARPPDVSPDHHCKSQSRQRKHSDSSSHSRRHTASSTRSRSQSRSPPATSRRHSSKRSRSPQEDVGGTRRSHSRSKSGSPPTHSGRRTHSRRSRSRSPTVSSSSQRRRGEHGSRRSHSRSRSRSPPRHRRGDHSRRSRSRSRSPGRKPRDYKQHGGRHSGGGYRGRGDRYYRRERTWTPVVSSKPAVGGRDSSQSQQPLFAPPAVHREPDPNAEKLTPEEKLERAMAAAQAVRSKVSQPSVSSLSTTPSTVNPLLKTTPALAQKKKLMWNKKSPSASQWEGVTLGEEGDSEAQEKFRRLMGMGKGASSSTSQSTKPPGEVSGQSETMREKHEKLRRDLEQQYEASRYMTHLAKGSGLGFGFSSSS